MKYFVLILFASCSYINQQSNDYYHSKQVKKHGFQIAFSDEADAAYDEVDEKSVLKGREIYLSKCASCHGNAATKQFHSSRVQKLTSLQEIAKSNTHFRLLVSISEKTASMPGWKDFRPTDKELLYLSAFIKSL